MDKSFFYKEFGKLVRMYRKQLHLTQEGLATRLGLSRTSVTNIEKGRQKILLHQLPEMAMALEVSQDALLPKYDRSTPQEQLAEEAILNQFPEDTREFVRKLKQLKTKV